MKKILVVLVLIVVGVLSFMYLGTYSEGTQAGKIMKISKKGLIFKTWEGRLDMETMGATDRSQLGTKVFEFSIESDNEDLLERLRAAQLTGERVNLKFEQKYFKYFWNGETKYFAIGLETSGLVTPVEDKKIPQEGV